ncbi:hypothetical protein ANTQUA_LOCUS2438 [Anthophora quadrimaculata]
MPPRFSCRPPLNSDKPPPATSTPKRETDQLDDVATTSRYPQYPNISFEDFVPVEPAPNVEEDLNTDDELEVDEVVFKIPEPAKKTQKTRKTKKEQTSTTTRRLRSRARELDYAISDDDSEQSNWIDYY